MQLFERQVTQLLNNLKAVFYQRETGVCRLNALQSMICTDNLKIKKSCTRDLTLIINVFRGGAWQERKGPQIMAQQEILKPGSRRQRLYFMVNITASGYV